MRLSTVVRISVVLIGVGAHLALSLIDSNLRPGTPVQPVLSGYPATTLTPTDLQGAERVVVGSRDVEPFSVPSDTLSWQREATFLDQDYFLKFGKGPDLVQVQTPVAEGAVKVLAVADSLLWGTGRASSDETWSRQLEIELNRRHGIGTHQVHTLARPDSSFLDYSEWLDPERIRTLDPDVIVIGYYINDPIPSGYERLLCPDKVRCELGTMSTLPSYHRCLRGGEGVFGWFARNVSGRLYPNLTIEALRRNCDDNRFEAINGFDERAAYADPERNPYSVFIPEAARNILRNAGDIPVLLLPTPLERTTWEANQPYLSLLSAEGLTPVPIPATISILTPGFSEAAPYWTTPIDMHPTKGIARFYARDAADAIDRLNLAKPDPTTTLPPLLSSTTPFALVVDETRPDSVTISMPDPTSSAMEKQSVRHMGVDGEMAVQQVPCGHMGRPHLRLDPDPLRADGRNLVVTYIEGGHDVLAVVAVTYDARGLKVHSPLQKLTKGSSLSYPSSSPVDHLLIGSPDAGCRSDRALLLPALELEIALR